MIPRLLEEIARDKEANATARVTAIRALRVFPEPQPLDVSLYPANNVLPMSRTGRRRTPRTAEE